MPNPLDNRYGHFDSGGRRFVITDPRTPMPWVNVLCNGRFGLVISQNGGGFSWFDNSQLNVLTRWEMDLARDDHGKFLYLADLDTQDVWSLAPQPCQPQYEQYRCEHAPGLTRFITRAHQIDAQWTLAVAPSDAAEVWHITLTNRASTTRRLRIASFFEWCCGVAPDTKREFHRLFFTTRHDPAGIITARKNMWDAPMRNDASLIEREKGHWNRPWPYAAAHAIGLAEGVSFSRPLAIGDKATFFGRYGSPARPAAMCCESPVAPDALNNFGRFGDASAALGGDFTLAPGATATFAFSIAIAENEDEAAAAALARRYAQPALAARTIDAAAALWDKLLAPSAVKSSLPDFDLLNTCWLPYQAVSGRLWARTGYYQQSGAFGYRDQLQDSQVWLPRDPARTREQILLHAAHQFADGSVFHWWHPLAEFGLRTLCSDDYLWLPFLTAQYIKDTGDWSILRASAPFVDRPEPASLLEHCALSITRSLARLSPRGLPLIGSCDWNDGLSSMGVEGHGESVWLAQFLIALLEDFARVVESSHGPAPDSALAARYRAARTDLIHSVDQHAWEAHGPGQPRDHVAAGWYRAATRDDGRWIGSRENDEGKLFLNTQTWAILSDAAPPDRAAAAWSAVKEHLLAPMGPLLSWPAYTEPDTTIGYITRYAPGLRENGGVYMHAATWALAAAAKRRDVASVEKIWRAVSPPSRCASDPDAYWAEPYVMPGNVDGPLSSTPGKAGWTWYTGSAAWLNRVSLEWIIGLRPAWEGLLIDPCPFPALGRVEASRLWRGRTIRVRFDSAAWSAQAAPRLSINGRDFSGNLLTPDDVQKLGSGAGEIVIDVSWAAGPPRPAGATPRAVAAAEAKLSAGMPSVR